MEDIPSPIEYILKYSLWEIDFGPAPDSRQLGSFERKIEGENYAKARKNASRFLRAANDIFRDDATNIISPTQTSRREYREIFFAGKYS